MSGETDRPWATRVSFDPEVPGPDEISDELLAAVEEDGDAGRPGDGGLHLRLERAAQGRRAHARVHHPDHRLLRGDAVRRRQHLLCGFPFFWIGGFLVLGGALQSGLTVCCLERFEAEAALDMVEKRGLLRWWRPGRR